MSLEELLISLGLNISKIIYDLLKDCHSKNNGLSADLFKGELLKNINIENADIKADKIINFLAENGYIVISGTNIYAPESIKIESSPGGKFNIENKSKSQTKKTSIEVGLGARIVGSNGAKIEQREDGSIRFYV